VRVTYGHSRTTEPQPNAHWKLLLLLLLLLLLMLLLLLNNVEGQPCRYPPS
jgi:uncharacterized integral membrane protein